MRNIAKSKAFKLLSMVLAVLVLGVSVLAIVTDGFRSWGRSEIVPPVIDGGFVSDDQGNDLSDDEVHPMPKNMMFRASAADGRAARATIQAIIEPIDATNQNLTWEHAWVNPNSAWATGKDVFDYFFLLPGSDPTIMTLECVEPFAEQIIITVTSVDNPEAQATCMVDYAKRLEGLDMVLGGVSGDSGMTIPSKSTVINTLKVYPDQPDLLRSITFVEKWGVGTVEDNIDRIIDVRFSFTAEFSAAFQAQFPALSLLNNLDLPVGTGLSSGSNFFGFLGITDSTSAADKNAVFRLLDEFAEKGVFTLSVETMGDRSEVTETYLFSVSDLHISVTGVRLGETTLII